MSNQKHGIEAQFRREFLKLAEDAKPIELHLTKVQAWCLLATIQLASRHPEASESAALAISTNIGRQLQEAIAADGALATIAREGWE